MKTLAWILAVVFGLAFVGATLMNADLIGKSRRGLASAGLRGRAAEARYQVMVVLPDVNDSYFQGLLEGIQAAAPQADSAVQVFRYPSGFPAQAEQYYEIALRAKVDGLVMFTPRDDRTVERAEKARRSGVVFIPVGIDPPAGNPPGFIGTGSLRQGLEGGRRICNRLGDAARVGVILPATGSGDPTFEPLYRGVAAALKVFPGAAVVSALRAEPGVLSGVETASTMLRSHPEINALFCSSSQDTVGAAQVVVDLNRVGRVLIIGADASPEIRRYLERGIISASIVRNSQWIGHQAVEAFFRAKENHPRLAPQEADFSIMLATTGSTADSGGAR